MPPEAPEIDSPEFRRAIFRRFRISVMLGLVLVPGLMWLLVNLAGKREWRQVQQEMKQQGIALRFSELDLPTRAEVPDAENFCAIPWLVARDNNSASAEMTKAAEEFKTFASTGFVSNEEHVSPNLGSVSLGQPANVLHWSVGLGASREERNRIANGARIPFSTAEAWQVVGSKLEAFAPRWQDLEKAMDRPQAHWLPTTGDLNTAGRSPFGRRLSVRTALLRNLTTALGLRAMTALERGELATALRSVEIQWRIVDAAGREPGIKNLREAKILARLSLRTAMHCLWSPAVVNDAESLEALQAALERVDFAELRKLASRRDMVFIVEGILHARDHRDPHSAGLVSGNAGWRAAGEDLLPNGWYDSIAAEAAEIYAHEILLPMQGNGPFERNTEQIADLRDHYLSRNLEERARAFRQPVHVFVANHASLLFGSLEIECRRRQAIIVCALYRYAQANNGKFPTELDLLVPDFVNSVPLDPLSSPGPDGKNQAMGYLPAEKNALGPPFRLWSVGYDMQDDGGQLNLYEHAPLDTNLGETSYLGDFPWPVEPLVIEEQENATAD